MAKERIKENVIDAPTLFVGVGGTGCRIVRRVAEMCRPGERENVNFVCLDTNVNDLASVSGSRSHIYTVQTSNTQTVGQLSGLRCRRTEQLVSQERRPIRQDGVRGCRTGPGHLPSGPELHH
mgnify:CR=1 FL=1